MAAAKGPLPFRLEDAGAEEAPFYWIEATISLSPLSAPMAFARIGLPSARFLLQRLSFLSASAARWLPTRSKRTVRPSSSFIPMLLLLADTGQFEPESAAERLVDFAGAASADALPVVDVVPAAHDMSTKTPL